MCSRSCLVRPYLEVVAKDKATNWYFEIRCWSRSRFTGNRCSNYILSSLGRDRWLRWRSMEGERTNIFTLFCLLCMLLDIYLKCMLEISTFSSPFLPLPPLPISPYPSYPLSPLSPFPLLLPLPWKFLNTFLTIYLGSWWSHCFN